jgi:putative capsular polysaccharide synthesis protein
MNILQLARRIYRGVELYGRLYIVQQIPLLIYTVGRTGSTSLRYSLQKYGVFAIHIQSLQPTQINNPRKPRSWKWVSQHIIEAHRPCRIIVSIRDPMGMLTSGFYSKIRRFGDSSRSLDEYTVDELVGLFRDSLIDEQKKKALINWYLDWFDDDFLPSTGIDIYQFPFPADIGYMRINQGNMDVVVMRAEIGDDQKVAIISNLIERKNFVLERYRTAEQKGVGVHVSEFRSRLILPRAVLDEIYNSRYAQHFLTAEEREQAIRQYLMPE